MWVRIAANAPVYYEPQILAGFRRHGDNQSAIQQRTGANMQDMARAIKIWKDYLPADSRVQLEQQGRRYWADISLMLAQHFFSNDDIAACTSQLRAAKALWNHGRHRSRRLRLEAKVLFYRALGRRAITAVRQLRRRIDLFSGSLINVILIPQSREKNLSTMIPTNDVRTTFSRNETVLDVSLCC